MSQKNEDATLIEAGRMASRLIHDFKNQLGGLKLYASYLKKRFADNAEGVEIADKIILGLNEMAEQAGLVAKLTRPIQLRREMCDLPQFLEMVLNSLKPQIDGRRLQVKTDFPATLPKLSFDLQQMQVALGAFITRAVAASSDGSELLLQAKPAPAGVEILVADQGETLPAERLQTFFDPLTNERINPISLGLGLGRRIVELHGGEVAAEAGTPAGTRVRVTIPVEEPI